MATALVTKGLLFFMITIGFLENNAFAADCKTSLTTIQPKEDISDDDNKQYVMINIPGFEQNATSIQCLPNQLCKKGKCKQDYKLHQFLTVPAGKQTFELSELKFRFFQIPYGCKCAA